MPYVAPALSVLRTKIARELRDSALTTFIAAQIDDFINEGIVELNRARPPEKTQEMLGDAVLTGLTFDYVFMVEMAIRPLATDSKAWLTVPPDVMEHGYGRNGWTYFGNALFLSPIIISALAQAVTRYTAARTHINIWGYGTRDLVAVDADIPAFIDAADEMMVRKYARMRGYQTLVSDRMLFSQWQAQANNADVSQTQMLGAVNTAEQEWERLRKRMYVIRRPAIG